MNRLLTLRPLACALALLLLLSACSSTRPATRPLHSLIDQKATQETRALYDNLFALVERGEILFGQQDPTPYGVEAPTAGRKAEELERDADVVKTGGALPAVHGWNVAYVGQRSFGIDTVDFALQRDLAIRAYKRGAVNTFAWHAPHPSNRTMGIDSTSGTIADVLPGGPYHSEFVERLDAVADYLDTFETGFWLWKEKVPIIFRPWHEHTGTWFWWGENATNTPEQYADLWRFTVNYLRDERGLHHLIWAYSPDIFDTREAYFKSYPGDAYVDILGFDDYYDFYGEGRTPQMFTDQLVLLTEFAEERGKVAALTEFGAEFDKMNQSLVDEWWTDTLLAAMRADPRASRIAYMLTWRNARTNHHYVPYPGHPSEGSFRDFLDDPSILTEGELPDLYR